MENITRRDYFAGQAITGLLFTGHLNKISEDFRNPDSYEDVNGLVAKAYLALAEILSEA